MRALWPRRSGTTRLHLGLQGVRSGVQRLTRFQRQTSLFGLLQLPCLYEVQQSACQQKGTPEFFQDENPTPFVDVSVRYTAESRPDHRFLAHDRPHSCVCYSCVWMVLCPALIAGNEHFIGKNGTLRWSILVGKQKHNVQSPTGILILLTSGIWNPRSSPSKESKSGIQAPLIDKKFKIQYREIGIHSLKSRIQGYL